MCPWWRFIVSRRKLCQLGADILPGNVQMAKAVSSIIRRLTIQRYEHSNPKACGKNFQCETTNLPPETKENFTAQVRKHIFHAEFIQLCVCRFRNVPIRRGSRHLISEVMRASPPPTSAVVGSAALRICCRGRFDKNSGVRSLEIHRRSILRSAGSCRLRLGADGVGAGSLLLTLLR